MIPPCEVCNTNLSDDPYLRICQECAIEHVQKVLERIAQQEAEGMSHVMAHNAAMRDPIYQSWIRAQCEAELKLQDEAVEGDE